MNPVQSKTSRWRARQFIVTGLTVASLPGAVVMTALLTADVAGHSGRYCELARTRISASAYSLALFDGCIRFFRTTPLSLNDSSPDTLVHSHALGFHYYHGITSRRTLGLKHIDRVLALDVPYWFAAAATLILPVQWLVRRSLSRTDKRVTTELLAS